MFDGVTLMVYEWKGVQPGTLSWSFPTAAAAALAAQTMTNAERWLVFERPTARPHEGTPFDLAKLRAEGKVLLEQPGRRRRGPRGARRRDGEARPFVREG